MNSQESRSKILAGPEFFDCGPLAARISARQCLLNQGKAHGLKVFGTRFMGKERLCLDCPEGNMMQAYPPAPLGTPAPPEPVRPKKLPAWLKNASAAVRRDYLKRIGG